MRMLGWRDMRAKPLKSLPKHERKREQAARDRRTAQRKVDRLVKRLQKVLDTTPRLRKKNG